MNNNPNMQQHVAAGNSPNPYNNPHNNNYNNHSNANMYQPSPYNNNVHSLSFRFLLHLHLRGKLSTMSMSIKGLLCVPFVGRMQVL